MTPPGTRKQQINQKRNLSGRKVEEPLYDATAGKDILFGNLSSDITTLGNSWSGGVWHWLEIQ